MGSNWSSLEEEPVPDPWWPSDLPRTSTVQSARNEELSEVPSRGTAREEELEALKQELARKRALRHEALAALQAELRDLRSRVEEETNLRRKAEEERDKLKALTRVELQKELESEKEEKKKLLEERDRLIEVVEEKAGLERQVQALKDVSQIGKEMLRIRELQVKELKKKLVELNISSVVAPPEDLRLEYEKQIENIRKLRTLYEERATATLLEHRRELEREEARIAVLETKLSDVQKEMEDYKEIKKELERKIEKLEFTIQENDQELEKTKDALFSSSVQNSTLNSQMALINNLFSQMLVSPEVDLDRLTRLLKEHHGLITDLTIKGDSNEVAALLVELAEQMDKEQESDEKVQHIDEENSPINNPLQSEIASNLSKVWRVMIELLSHHQTPPHPEHAGGADSCYKSIQTPSGPRSVISVSQTFLTLKDLILEKNRLVKEVGRLKTLNDHLENRLGSQEKRLSVVTTELRKTWSVVNKLKAQHKQLHTHEKILRYELQQKRCMLTELKGELEHCKDKWEKARQKNSQTEEDWKKLRKEFAARKSRKESNSAESGYEEEEVQSPPSEPHKYMKNVYELSTNEVSEPELSEEDIEHSDGNSFDTVIELLNIDCIDGQQRHQPEVPFVLCDVPPQTLELPPNLLPLTGSEFTEGLDQIESEDLAAVLDIQYQTQLLGADYNLSLPSSSGSSPIPTDNDDFTSSEVDVSEEDMSSNDNHIYSSPLPHTNQTVSEDVLLFGSNSSKNISRFLDGLFVEPEESLNTKTQTSSKMSLNIPSSSKTDDSDLTPTPFNNERLFHSAADLSTKVNENPCSFFSSSNNMDDKSHPENEQTQRYPSLCQTYQQNKTEEASNGQSSDQVHETSSDLVEKTQDELLNAREERLKRLEHQCRSLVNKVTSTSFRSEIISNKLDELHLAYGPVDQDKNDDCFAKEKANSKQVAAAQCQLELLSGASTSKGTIPLPYQDIEEKETNCSSSSFTSQIEAHLPNPTESDTAESEARTTKLKRLEDQCKCLYSKISTKSISSRCSPSRCESLPRRLSVPLSEKTLASSVQPTCSKSPILDPAINEPNVISQEDLNRFVPNSQEDQDLKETELPGEPTENVNQCSSGPSLEPLKHTCEGAKKHRSPEEILEARAERFKRLEDQCKSLLSKMTATSLRSEIISNKLDELHSCYGSSEDASDSEENSLLSKNAEKKLTSAPSSSRHKKQIKPLCENNEPTQSTLSNSDTINSVNDEVQECSQIHLLAENMTNMNHDGNTALLRRISEEILPEEENRFNTSQNERDPNLNDT